MLEVGSRYLGMDAGAGVRVMDGIGIGDVLEMR
jgi:hypothetical protein